VATQAHPFAPGQYVTVFRSRLRPDAGPEYGETAEKMLALARARPGFVDFKSFTADDGERVSVITFADAAAQEGWRTDAEHLVAQQAGRRDFYAEYAIQVCECRRAHRWQPA